MTDLFVRISIGEAADKVSILQLKRERFREPKKRANVEAQLALLAPALFERVGAVPGFAALFARLKEINASLWDIEEELRRHEERKDFGPEFIRLARSVYLTNDRRMRLKREVDVLFGSPLVEEKSYARDDSASD
jgi:hypothetical protein